MGKEAPARYPNCGCNCTCKTSRGGGGRDDEDYGGDKGGAGGIISIPARFTAGRYQPY